MYVSCMCNIRVVRLYLRSLDGWWSSMGRGKKPDLKKKPILSYYYSLSLSLSLSLTLWSNSRNQALWGKTMSIQGNFVKAMENFIDIE